MEAKNMKKGMGAVIALAVAIVVVVVILTVVVVGVIKDNGGATKKENTTLYTLAGVTNTTKEDKGYLDWDETQNSAAASDVYNFSGGNTQVEAGDVVTTPSTTKKSDVYDPVAEYEKLTKNGDNKLSDHHNNKYIKLVSEKYNVDTELLVAIYSEPDTGNNFVLEFSGKRDSDGNVVKSPDTLTKVYSIDKNQKISVATGKTTGNIGVSYAEGTLCFNMIKAIVMPQYPEYFTGVDE